MSDSKELETTQSACWNCKGAGELFATDGCPCCEDEDDTVPVDYDDYDADF